MEPESHRVSISTSFESDFDTIVLLPCFKSSELSKAVSNKDLKPHSIQSRIEMASYLSALEFLLPSVKGIERC